MYVQVRLLKGFSELLWYQVPDSLHNQIKEGAYLNVPFRTQSSLAVVERMSLTAPSVSFALKAIHSIEAFPKDNHYNYFINSIAHYYQVDKHHFIKRMRQFFLQKEDDAIFATQNFDEKKNSPGIQLSEEQQSIVDSIKPALSTDTFYPALLHGVTGSGKTEIYKQLIEENNRLQKTTVFLLPEVTLAVQFSKLLSATFDNVISFHSATSIKEKRLLWQSLLSEKPIIIVGVHLPVLLPIANLGLIIVDEEHDCGYQEKKHPRLNTKEVALLRAQRYKIPIILGSATPSISSLYNVRHKHWHFFQLKKRFAGAFPTINIVSLDKTKRRNFWISKELDEAIADKLLKGEQIILFLNRRGFSFFVQCNDCNTIIMCKQCSVSLTFHEPNILRCHYCDFSIIKPTSCDSCKKHDASFTHKGIGTQQLVHILQKLYPQAIIARADLDATINRKKWQTTLNSFTRGEINILVGTQTITKGYHFPNVTLVGVIWADLNVHFPLYNAAETALQQLIQVAGRAGREHNQSSVFVQTMTDHHIFHFLNEENYLNFYDYEIETRSTSNYPPLTRLIEIELKYLDEKTVDEEAHRLADYMRTQVTDELLILGPARPLIDKVKNVFSRKIYIKTKNINRALEIFATIDRNSFFSSIFFTPNPMQ